MSDLEVQRGREAMRSGVEIQDNPYQGWSNAYADWRSGWILEFTEKEEAKKKAQADASSLLANPVAYRLKFDPGFRVVENRAGEWIIEKLGEYLKSVRRPHSCVWTTDPFYAEPHPTPEAAALAAKAWHEQQEGKK